MKELGMPTAFEPGAEFPYFCNVPDFYIGNMFQKAAIDLDEEGTTAAAVTGIEGQTGENQPRIATFHANRPFFYIISERSTGTIFFIGQFLGSITAGVTKMENGKTDTSLQPIYDLQGRRVGTGHTKGLKPGIYIVGSKKVMIK